MKVFGTIAYAFWCTVIMGVGVGAGWIGLGKDTVTNYLLIDRIPLIAKPKTPEEVFGTNVFYLLVLGCDEDRSFIDQGVTRHKARSDMMLCMRLDFDRNLITGISIPRDTLVELPGYRRQKINAYHVLGGADLAEQAAESVLGVDIDRTVVLDFDAFQKMVNLVGGVEVFVAKKMKWTDRAGDLYIDLKPGRQVLNGYNAMGFVRFRHSDSDYERQKRQKELMVAFQDALMANKLAAPAVADEAVNLLGGGLKPIEIAALMKFGQKVGQDNIKMGMVPVTEGRDRAYGYYMLVDTNKIDGVLEEFLFKPKSFAADSN
ncbi:MAG: LCP family protein [Fimbriimonadaceae bacterium]|nr:LCP family protein [Fimbriimonadaceae bacterium]